MKSSTTTIRIASLWFLAGTIGIMHTALHYVQGGGALGSSTHGRVRSSHTEYGARMPERSMSKQGSQSRQETGEQATDGGGGVYLGLTRILGTVCIAGATLATFVFAMPSSSLAQPGPQFHDRTAIEFKQYGGIALVAAAAVANSKSEEDEHLGVNYYGGRTRQNSMSPYAYSSLGGSWSGAAGNPIGNTANAYQGKMDDITPDSVYGKQPDLGPWSPNRASIMQSGHLGHREVYGESTTANNEWTPAVPVDGKWAQLGKVRDSANPRGDLFGMRSWSPSSSEAFGTVQKAYMGKVYELPAEPGQSDVFNNKTQMPLAAQSRSAMVDKEYMGKVYSVPATDNFKFGRNNEVDTLQIGKSYESRDESGNWLPVKVEGRNHDGSYTCSLADEMPTQYGQPAFWNKVWACNCREYDSMAAWNSRIGQGYGGVTTSASSPLAPLATKGPLVLATG